MTSSIRTAREITETKRKGAHFTPPALADFLARRLLEWLPAEALGAGIEVLDPSCGDGELLRAFVEAAPKQSRPGIKLVGMEDDDHSLEQTRMRLQYDHATYELLHADFLDASDAFSELPSLAGVLLDSNVSTMLRQPDVIIANPPYVRTQVLGAARAQKLAARFQLTGRVDLYHAFLIAMTDVLKPGGLLGVITSNRFLTIRSGESVRAFLTERYDLLEVIDLGDTKLFSAAVLPAIIIARKRSQASEPSRPRFTRVYEELSPNGATPASIHETLFDALEGGQGGHFSVQEKTFRVTFGELTLGGEPRDPWRMTSHDETTWAERVERSTPYRIADFAKVRVGIKTTADSVFIRTDWDALPKAQRPESELLHPLYTHFDAARWRANKPSEELRRILYTHETVDGKRRAIDFTKYPRAWRYLQENRERLEGREFVIEAGRKWYEIWVPQDPAAWGKPKVVFPDISVEPRFFFDAGGSLVNGDCYWLTLPPEQIDLLHLIQGAANSKVMARYHDLAFQNKLYSGRRRFISQFVERYPIPDPASADARGIVAAVRELNNVCNDGERSALEARIDDLVARSFGVVLP